MESTPWVFGPGLPLQGCTFVRHRSWPLQCKGSQLRSSVGLCSARVPNVWRRVKRERIPCAPFAFLLVRSFTAEDLPRGPRCCAASGCDFPAYPSAVLCILSIRCLHLPGSRGFPPPSFICTSSVGLCSARVPNGWSSGLARLAGAKLVVSVYLLTLMDLPGDLHPPYCVGMPVCHRFPVVALPPVGLAWGFGAGAVFFPTVWL